MKKKFLKKTIVITLITTLMITGMSVGASASTTPFVSMGGGSGIVMTTQEFNLEYATDNYVVTDTNLNAALDAGSAKNEMENIPEVTSRPSVEYGKINYNIETHEISFDALFEINNEKLLKHFSGKLYNSWKKSHGVNSIVGDIDDLSKTFDVLHFEIYNDTNDEMFYGLFPFEGRPTIKLYVQSEQKLYLFETAIPADMATITIPNVTANQAKDGCIDGFWFEDIVVPAISQIPSKKKVITRADHMGTYNVGTLAASWVVAGVTYWYYAEPSITYRFTDVNSNDATWFAAFNIDDAYAYVNGVKNSLTGLRITNLDISFATGPYTMIFSGTPVFDVHGTSNSYLYGLIAWAAGQNVGTSLAATIISGLVGSSLSARQIQNGNDTLVPFDKNLSKGRGFRYEIPQPYFLQHTSNFVQYNLEVSASSFGQNVAGKSGNKTGQLRVNFDYYTGDGTNINTHYCPTISQSYYCDLSGFGG